MQWYGAWLIYLKEKRTKLRNKFEQKEKEEFQDPQDMREAL